MTPGWAGTRFSVLISSSCSVYRHCRQKADKAIRRNFPYEQIRSFMGTQVCVKLRFPQTSLRASGKNPAGDANCICRIMPEQEMALPARNFKLEAQAFCLTGTLTSTPARLRLRAALSALSPAMLPDHRDKGDGFQTNCARTPRTGAKACR
jgi:hypothetical protein